MSMKKAKPSTHPIRRQVSFDIGIGGEGYTADRKIQHLCFPKSDWMGAEWLYLQSSFHQEDSEA